MQLRSLRHRIVLVFVGLLVLVMALIMLVLRASSERIAAGEVRRELNTGSVVFARLLEQNQRHLETGAAVLAADFAFREAIATQDLATMSSAMRNHGERVGARTMMVVSNEGKLLAATSQEISAGQPFPFPDLIVAAEAAGRSAGFRQMKNGRLYQMVLAPVMAPRRIAWVAIGFEVDDHSARELADMTGLEVSIIRTAQGRHELLASSVAPGQRERLAQALVSEPVVAGALSAQHKDDRGWLSVQMPLAPQLAVLLRRSAAEVRAPFEALEITLLVVLAGGALAFAAGSIMLARRIVQPLKELSSAAQRIETGDYAHPLPALAPDEIGQLAGSFERMREGIASREERIVRLAYVDQLTDLPNRTRLLAAFDELPQGQPLAVAVLNIHRFSMINNALGHPVGDQLLRTLGQRLSHVVRAPEVLARLWGDQFAILLPGADREAARALGRALLAALDDPITLHGQRLDIGASIGIALCPQDGRDASTLLRRAELAMAEARAAHRGLGFADDIGSEPPHEHLSMIGDMREAMAAEHFVLHYQPKLLLAEGRVAGVEALLRWQDPVRGTIAPGRFIPFAEQTGFIRKITPWVLDRVARQLAEWQRAGLSLSISANLSAFDLQDAGLVARVAQLLRQHALRPSQLCLEITESALMEDPARALETLGQLAALGVKLSIDDYGVGQASLAYLKSLPVNELKIDRAFIVSLASSPRDAAIVESTIRLCKALGLTVVAEGVEEAEQLAWLREHGCDLAQGFGIGRPMSAAALQEWLGQDLSPGSSAPAVSSNSPLSAAAHR